MSNEYQEAYRDLVSVDVGIEDDIGIFGNLMTNVIEAQLESERETPSGYDQMSVRERSNK